MRTGFIGLGNMGFGMANNLVKAGFPANKMVVSGSIEAEPVFPVFD